MNGDQMNNTQVWDATTIKELRLSLGLSQDHFSHQVGVAAYTVRRWEKGVSVPNLESVAKLNELRKEANK